MLDYLVNDLIGSNAQLEKLLVLGLYELPNSKFLPAFQNILYQRCPHLIRHAHEVSFYIDASGYMHWFDANIGWFKSNDNDISLNELRNLLAVISEVLQYQDYKVCALFNKYALKQRADESAPARRLIT